MTKQRRKPTPNTPNPFIEYYRNESNIFFKRRWAARELWEQRYMIEFRPTFLDLECEIDGPTDFILKATKEYIITKIGPQ